MQAGHKKIQPVKVVHALTVLIVIYCVLHESRPDHMTLCLSVHVAIWSFMLVISYLCSHHMPSFARPTIWNGWADCTNFSIKGTLQLLPRVSNWWWRSRERVPDIGNVEWKSANMFGYANIEGNSHFCVWSLHAWSSISIAEILCPELQNIADGIVIITDRTVDSLAVYNCSSGFELVGIDVRVCMESGNWNGTEPICKGIISLSAWMTQHWESLSVMAC